MIQLFTSDNRTSQSAIIRYKDLNSQNEKMPILLEQFIIYLSLLYYTQTHRHLYDVTQVTSVFIHAINTHITHSQYWLTCHISYSKQLKKNTVSSPV